MDGDDQKIKLGRQYPADNLHVLERLLPQIIWTVNSELKIKDFKMKKNLIIGLLTIVSLMSLTYGYFQKERADEQEALAIEQSKIAREAVIKAEQSQKEAQIQRDMAIMNTQRAMDQLEMALKAANEAKNKN